MRNRNSAIDLAKYIGALMVVAIHTALFSDVNDALSFTVVHIICRVAVPFFAVCSGYFLSTRFTFGPSSKSANLAVMLRQWKKMLFLYALWSIIYLFYSIPHWIEIGWFSLWAFVDYAIATLTQGSYYHLWYLWGMIFALPVFYILLQCLPKNTGPSPPSYYGS